MRNRRPKKLLLITLLSTIALVYGIFFLSPATTIPLAIFNIPILIFFFPLVFLFVYSLVTLSFKSKVHGVLVAGFIVAYLLFRLHGLSHPFFLIMLLALFLVLELLFSNKK